MPSLTSLPNSQIYMHIRLKLELELGLALKIRKKRHVIIEVIIEPYPKGVVYDPSLCLRT